MISPNHSQNGKLTMSAILSYPKRLCDVATPVYAVDIAVRALRAKLNEMNFNPEYARVICIHASKEHGLAGLVEAGYIDPEDEAILEDTFADAWPEVDPRSVLWKNPDRWATTEHPTPEESRQYAEMAGVFDPADAPLDPPVDLEPTDADWDEFAHWSAGLDPFSRYEEPELAEIGCRR
jgi:hypothetical protein